MKLAYDYGKEDHIRALGALRARASRDSLLIRAFAKAAAGCAVYLSTATLLGALGRNDSLSYLSGVLVFLVLLMLDNPRLLPALRFERDLKAGRLPRCAVGRREMDVGDRLLVIRRGESEQALRYRHVSGMTSFPEGLLIYLADGTAEFLPARVIRAAGAEACIQEGIRLRVVQDKQPGADPAPLPEPGGEGGAQYRFDQAEYLKVNALHERHTRLPRLKEAKALVWALILLWIALGSACGLAGLIAGRPAPFAFMGALWALGLLSTALGAVILYRPARLINWVMKKKLALHQAPAYFFEQHSLWWDGRGLTHVNGDASLSLAWPCLSRALSDGERLLFYQHRTLVCFIPLAALEAPKRESLLAAVRAGIPLRTLKA